MRAPFAPPRLSLPRNVDADAHAVITNCAVVRPDARSFAFSETTSASFTHAAANRYYYHVRARNQSVGCNTTSLFSTPVSVLVSIAPVAITRILPVVGSVPGSFGAYFKTSVQLYNAKSSAVSVLCRVASVRSTARTVGFP